VTAPAAPQPESDRSAAGPRILLVSPDLMSTSRIAGLTRDACGRLETLRSLDDQPPEGPFHLVLVDLQALAGDPAVLVSRVRGIIDDQRSRTGCAARLVAYGPHVAKDRLDQAKAAGADAVVSRGELLGGFPAILRRWCP
jgi:hypothetical protein